MGLKTFNLPDPGEGLTEAEIVSWKVKPGDAVKVNDIVVEIETSKSLVELPIPWEGTVGELLVAEGTEVEVGEPIITVEVAGAGDPAPAAAPPAAAPPAAAPPATAPATASAAAPAAASCGAAAARVFNLPDPGEGLTEAEIVSWKVKPGDAVKVNDIVVEIETSKSLVELPIPWEGTVGELLVAEGQEVEVGKPIITVHVAGDAAAPAPTAAAPAPAAAPEEAAKREPNLVGYGAISGSTTRRARKGRVAASPAPAAVPAAQPQAPAAAPTAPEAQARSGRPLAKPPVRKYAKDRGVDLSAVTPTGREGTVTRDDIDAYLSGGSSAAPATDASAAAPHATASGAATASPTAPQRSGERETRVPIKGVRKMTAQAMVGSAFTAPHVTEFVTIDVSATMELVERLKGDREFRDVKVTPLLVVAKALLLAVRRNPGVNATWDEAAQEIVQKNYVNLGIAAATPRGLIVPNIKDADAMTMRELADALGALVGTAREGRTQPADMSGGSITITNVGVFGVDTGTPIINPGESAILAVGAIRRMPWVIELDGAETIVPRWVTTLGLSFDHRLVDGDLGSRFLADIATILTDPTKALVWG